MNEAEVLIEQIRSTYNGNAWHGASIMNALKEVDHKEASLKPLSSRHTIWELVDHISAWLEVPVKIYREKKDYHDLPLEENWKPMGSTQEDWINTTKRLEKAIEDFVSVVEKMPLEDFDENVPNHDFNYRKLFYGALNHNLYHLGQISILKTPKPSS